MTEMTVFHLSMFSFRITFPSMENEIMKSVKLWILNTLIDTLTLCNFETLYLLYCGVLRYAANWNLYIAHVFMEVLSFFSLVSQLVLPSGLKCNIDFCWDYMEDDDENLGGGLQILGQEFVLLYFLRCLFLRTFFLSFMLIGFKLVRINCFIWLNSLITKVSKRIRSKTLKFTEKT